MNLTKILAELRNNRTRIEKAIDAIESLNHSTGRRKARTASRPSVPKHRRRHLSAAARRKLSVLMKKRWAAGKMRKKAA
jgi:hypothetical protein